MKITTSIDHETDNFGEYATTTTGESDLLGSSFSLNMPDAAMGIHAYYDFDKASTINFKIDLSDSDWSEIVINIHKAGVITVKYKDKDVTP